MAFRTQVLAAGRATRASRRTSGSLCDCGRALGLATEAKMQKPVIVSLRPSEDEKASGILSQRNVQKGLEALHRDGIVCLENVVPEDAIDRLDAVMQADAKTLMGRGQDGPFNYNLGNLQQGPPVNDPALFHPQIFLNPLATHLTSSFLGGTPTFSFLSGNTAVQVEGDSESLKGQPVHSDADFAHPDIPFACVVNCGLTTMAPENGSTEIWLGTHNGSGLHVQEGAHGERASGRIIPSILDERRKVSPPFQPVVPKGSLLVRDLRLWHAGRPNHTPTPRVMLAFIHFAPYYRQRMTLQLGRSLQPIFSRFGNGLAAPVEWKDEVDHLAGTFGNAFDFDQDP